MVAVVVRPVHWHILAKFREEDFNEDKKCRNKPVIINAGLLRLGTNFI